MNEKYCTVNFTNLSQTSEFLQMDRYRFNDTLYRFSDILEKHYGHQGAFWGKKVGQNVFLKIHFQPFWKNIIFFVYWNFV